MKAFAMCLLYLALVLTTTGCRALFSSSSQRSRTPWQNFDEAQAAYDKVVPHKTTLAELKTLGFDPISTPNVKILTYLDLIQRFIPNASISLKDLQPDVRDCIESKDCCHAYEMDLDMTNNKRFGNLALDMFGFDRRTKTSGWTFKALIIVKDDVVAYKIRSGEPNVDRIERMTKPLGPLQELDNTLLKLVGSM
ncbi:MAG: hypothetical protein DME25_18675 [Verrucomicrobia bacterium]|nr:MAG: hypothetical protein DME25_18675 [Verrucomicrobiota bacterium]